MSLNISLYAQYDPRWANVELAPGITMAQDGCLVTSIAMGLSNYGINVLPGDLCQKFKAVGGFNSDGSLSHDAIEKVYPNVSFYERVYTSNWPGDAAKVLVAEAIHRVKNLVDLGHAVYLHVDNVGHDGIADHFVACKGYSAGDLLENNPDGGVEQWFSTRFGDPSQRLYGYYSIIGDPANSLKYGALSHKLAEIKRGRNVQTYAKECLDDLIRS